MKRVVLMVCLLALAGLGGCARRSVDLVETGHIRVERTSAGVTHVQTPNVWAEDSQLVVSGYVERRPSYGGGILTGHVHVAIWKDGQELANRWDSWTPGSLPIKPPYLSSYIVRYPSLPPEGAMLRVYACRQEHPAPASPPGGA